MTDDALQSQEPAEHLRFRAYLSALEQVTDADEPGLIREVLADPGQMMAASAVLRHLDHRASALHLGPDYVPWAEMMTQATTGSPFLGQRLHEWSLLRAVALGQPWHPDTLLGSSNWLQLTMATTSNTDAVSLLAEQGRTKRIRSTAKTTLQRHSSH
ncbi:hypothetical protein [Streptacidiphilus cavernicola]|uniref:Ankyrin repeat domain-containing protein n=1 Tax=Streptacidiphilus cavernicola TaxID=3342716 RepID=A0ABV6VPC6_9ACTN